MCTFQGARFVRQQLDSFSAQTRLPDECVICDDGSQDGTREILKKYASTAPFACRIEENLNNLGTTANFEKAISLCQGDIIALADQDDIWFPQKLKTIEERFLASPSSVAVFSDGTLMGESSEPLPGALWRSHTFDAVKQKAFVANAFDVLLRRPFVTGATFAFRSRYCGLILPIPKKQIHDYWISLLLSVCGKIDLIAEPQIQYRWHPSQQMGLPKPMDWREKFSQVYEYVGDSYYPEIEQCEQWKERLLNIGRRFSASPEAIRKLSEQISHRRTRANLPYSFLGRCPIIVREAKNANYWRYSSGWKSIGKDLFLLAGNHNRPTRQR
jgi:glycosyltransferase involved in cell wall biosynthesis